MQIKILEKDPSRLTATHEQKIDIDELISLSQLNTLVQIYIDPDNKLEKSILD